MFTVIEQSEMAPAEAILFFGSPALLPYLFEFGERVRHKEQTAYLPPLLSRLLFPLALHRKKRSITGVIYVAYLYIAAILLGTAVLFFNLPLNLDTLDLWIAYIGAGNFLLGGIGLLIDLKDDVCRPDDWVRIFDGFAVVLAVIMIAGFLAVTLLLTKELICMFHA